MEVTGAGLRPVLIDSSLWIEYYHPRGDPSVRSAVTKAVAADQVVTVAIVVAEVAQGARTKRDLDLILGDLGACPMVSLDSEVTRVAASLLFALGRAGSKAPVSDALIAAAALVAGAELWHLSDEHYERLGAVATEALQGRSLSTRAFTRRA